MPGQFIAHYKITGKLGAGGMGEVFRATDTKLNREVAIKVLPESFAQDKERLARFQREAEVLASLNHPNVAAIHGLEESEGGKALVLELVEGETLAKRLKKGPLPVEEALEVCKQIAEALEAAHEKAIIHRDLKPGNIKFTEDGKVKVLDFGLAKATDNAQSTKTHSVDADSPTITDNYTKPGTILGTAAYMSPEQARGKHVDKRSDIWSFGCVLYECLTGKCLFKGEGVTETLAKIIEREPEWSALPENTPPTIRLLLRKCLTKDRKRRLHDIADARVDLEQAITDPSSSFIRLSDEALRETGARTGIQPLTVATIVLVALVATTLTWFLKPYPPDPTAIHVPAVIRGDIPLASNEACAFSLSPDGSSLAYTIWEQGTPAEIRVRSFSNFDDTLLVSSESGGGYNPFFSPDGDWIGFYDTLSFHKARVTGRGNMPMGLSGFTHLCRGTSWGREHIVYAMGQAPGLMKMELSKGVPQELTRPSEGESHRWPIFLPDGRHVLFVSSRAELAVSQVEAVDAMTGTRRGVILQNAGSPRYAGANRLLFERGGAIHGQRFDPDTLQVSGESALIVPQVIVNSHGIAQYDVSHNGVLAYTAGYDRFLDGALAPKELIWLDSNGITRQASDRTGDFLRVALSPRGDHMALQVRGVSGHDISVLDIRTSRLEPLVRNEGDDVVPAWSPDGNWIYFASHRNGNWGIYRIRYPIVSKEELVLPTEYPSVPDCVTEDYVIYAELKPDTGYDIGWIPRSEAPEPNIIVKEAFNDGFPQVSPDQKWMVYTVARDSNFRSHHVYVMEFPNGERGRMISQAGGYAPVWAKDGGTIFYHSHDRQIMSVTFQSDDNGFETGKPTPVVQIPASVGEPGFFQRGTDGRFLMIQTPSSKRESADTDGSNTINMIFNIDWPEGLR